MFVSRAGGRESAQSAVGAVGRKDCRAFDYLRASKHYARCGGVSWEHGEMMRRKHRLLGTLLNTYSIKSICAIFNVIFSIFKDKNYYIYCDLRGGSRWADWVADCTSTSF